MGAVCHVSATTPLYRWLARVTGNEEQIFGAVAGVVADQRDVMEVECLHERRDAAGHGAG